LRNALKCIAQYAFQLNPYPLILTIENFASPVQQRMMADIFLATFGASLYVPEEEGVLKSKQLPSPNQLKNKILLRGNASSVVAKEVSPMVDNAKPEDDVETADEGKGLPRSPVDPAFGKLIALPRVKFSPNFYNDIEDHPANGSASLTESKVSAYVEAEAPIATYTVSHLVKSYPKGIRQDSSNMSPMRSWLCGIQCVAMNCQTYDEGMDLVNGLFNINGSVGYVLKPKILLDGIGWLGTSIGVSVPVGSPKTPYLLDPRTKSDKVVTLLQIAIICGNYLPKAASGKGIVDPFVSLEVCGIPSDSGKAKTRSVRNNGFNPVWNENFTFPLNCPEMAMLRYYCMGCYAFKGQMPRSRLVVKDFDSTSANDFIGEFSVPISSIRSGYSHVRLNTGFEHSPDDAAALFVRVAFDGAQEVGDP
jgi:phosphatidylinositol phospholipase C delta